jgi:hypothetical protein
MYLRRGIIAGLSWGLAGLIGAALGAAAFTFDFAVDLQGNLASWRLHAPPGIMVIPMLLFFAGIVTYMPTRYVGFAKNLAILTVTTLPLGEILGALGRAYLRCKGTDHPSMYVSEVLMFLPPLTAVSLLLIIARFGPRVQRGSFTVESLPSAAATTEPAHSPEPAAGPVANGKSSPPAQ